MGVKFLKTGDPEPPPLESGKLRLYSLLYCAFAHRPRLVLAAKGIPFEEVNVNVMKKPEWYTTVNPQGKVPALEVAGGHVVIESLDICDYLDAKFPDSQLWPADQEARARQKLLLRQFDKIYPLYMQFMTTTDPQKLLEVVPAIAAILQRFEEELATQGSTFFGGDRPGMLDYMIWPWGERAEGIQTLYPDLKFPTEDFPQLMAWGAAMKEDAAVQQTALAPSVHANFLAQFASGSVDLDNQ